jgi:hypothetical protein
MVVLSRDKKELGRSWTASPITMLEPVDFYEVQPGIAAPSFSPQIPMWQCSLRDFMARRSFACKYPKGIKLRAVMAS